MKRRMVWAGVLALAVALTGCSGGGVQTTGGQTTSDDAPASNNPLEAIIAEAQGDFADTSQKILDDEVDCLFGLKRPLADLLLGHRKRY